jgi:hypothetical protein
VDGGNDTPSPIELAEKKKESEAKVDNEDPKANEPVESPLSPTSAEILGKLTQPSKPRKIIRVISGRNKDASRQTEDSPVKKSKRPAPVVAEAYSYVVQFKRAQQTCSYFKSVDVGREDNSHRTTIISTSIRTLSQAVCSVAVELRRHTTSLQVVGCAMVISFLCKIKNYKSQAEDWGWCMEFFRV